MTTTQKASAKAVAKFVRVSPFKLRPIVDGLRGKRLDLAFNWLYSKPCAKTVPVYKVLHSAWHNLKKDCQDWQNQTNLYVTIAKVDQGPAFKYSKPGSMGRSIIRRKRLSHIEVQIESKI